MAVLFIVKALRFEMGVEGLDMNLKVAKRYNDTTLVTIEISCDKLLTSRNDGLSIITTFWTIILIVKALRCM